MKTIEEYIREYEDCSRDVSFAGLQDLFWELVAALKEKEREIVALNSLRPIWAQGFSDDSTAAQVYSAGLAQIYSSLSVTTQTEAMKQIAALTAELAKKEEEIASLKARNEVLRVKTEDTISQLLQAEQGEKE